MSPERFSLFGIIRRMHSANNLKIPCPSRDEVKEYLDKWEEDDDLKETSNKLTELFTKTYPKNDDYYEVWIKAQVLNSAFNVNVPEIHKVAKHISMQKKVEVEMIRIGHGAHRKGARNESDLYSFATKYCSFCNPPDENPIFDSNVKRALIYFKEHCGFEFNGDLRRYQNFVCIIKNFKKVFGLNSSFRDVDKYLYLVGRELNPPKKKL